MTQKKIYIGIGCFLLVYLVGFLIYLFFPGINSNTKLYIAMKPNDLLYVKNRTWYLEKGTELQNNDKYDIYLDGEIQGKMEVKALDRWYAFQNGSSYQYPLTKQFVGISSNQKITKIEEMTNTEWNQTDISYVNQALREMKSTYQYQDVTSYANKKKVVADFDKDGEEESLYYFSNTMRQGYTEFFTLVFLVDHGKIEYIKKEKTSDIYGECNPNYVMAMNINHGSSNHIISSCSYFSQMGRCAYVTTAKDGTYQTNEVCIEE